MGQFWFQMKTPHSCFLAFRPFRLRFWSYASGHFEWDDLFVQFPWPLHRPHADLFDYNSNWIEAWNVCCTQSSELIVYLVNTTFHEIYCKIVVVSMDDKTAYPGTEISAGTWDFVHVSNGPYATKWTSAGIRTQASPDCQPTILAPSPHCSNEEGMSKIDP